jgi:hypothetical protein
VPGEEYEEVMVHVEPVAVPAKNTMGREQRSASSEEMGEEA